jgi:hypothetical protein
MTVEALLVVIALCLFCIYFVFEYQRAATPPYQEPLKPEADMVEQWKAATKADTLDKIDTWNAKVGDKIWHKEAAAELEPTPLNPQAAWPFPTGRQP